MAIRLCAIETAPCRAKQGVAAIHPPDIASTYRSDSFSLFSHVMIGF